MNSSLVSLVEKKRADFPGKLVQHGLARYNQSGHKPLTTAGCGNPVGVKVSQTQAKDTDIPSLPSLAVPQKQEAIQP